MKGHGLTWHMLQMWPGQCSLKLHFCVLMKGGKEFRRIVLTRLAWLIDLVAASLPFLNFW